MRALLLAVTCCVVVAPSLASAQAVARLLSVEGDTVTLQCVKGAIVNGDELEVFTPAGKTKGKVALPPGLDLVLTGDTIKGVRLGSAKVAAGGVAATPGQFGSFAAATQGLGAPAAPAPPAAPAFKESAAACTFTPAELETALGFKLGAGKGSESAFSTGTSFACTYGGTGSERRAVFFKRTVMTSGDPATNTSSMRKMLAGRLEAVAGDPDQAAWQVDQGDLTGVTLHYARGNSFTEVRVTGVNQKDSAAVAAMRKRVLKLRRLD